MRTIMFRARDIINNKWEKKLSMRTDDNLNTMYEGVVFEQYTGLKDKNGVKIYENDYIGNDTTDKMLVAIEKGHTVVVVKFKDSNISYTEMITQEEIDDQWFYVLGNIHDKEEL